MFLLRCFFILRPFSETRRHLRGFYAVEDLAEISAHSAAAMLCVFSTVQLLLHIATTSTAGKFDRSSLLTTGLRLVLSSRAAP